MANNLELFILDSQSTAHAIALGRRGDDVAIEKIPLDASVAQFLAFKSSVESSLVKGTARPSRVDIDKVGRDLFAWLFRGALVNAYNRVPAGKVSLQILSDNPQLKALPWEYILPPDRGPVPHRDRCVVRVLDTCGVDAIVTKRPRKIRVLFAIADPVDQSGVQWTDVKARMESTFSTLPDKVELVVVEGATRAALAKAIRDESFDIFHFLGHGDIQNGVGGIVLTDVKTHKSDFMEAAQLAALLSGKQVRLALLSACLTGAGNYSDDFSIVATALLRAGIPAVVANQVSIPNKTIAPFVGALYASLLQGGNIDHAVMEGRVAIFAGIQGTTTSAAVEWGIPTLYRLSTAAQLFEAP